MGAGLGPRRGDLDPHTGHGDRAVTLTGCTSSWPPPARARWTRRPVSCGQRAGQPRNIPISGGHRTRGRDTIASRLSDEVSWLRQCAGWLAHLDADSCPPAVNLRPSADWPDRAVVTVDLARVAAVIDRRRRRPTRPRPAGRGPGHRRGPARPAGGTRPAGRPGPGVPGLLLPRGMPFLNPATGAGLGDAWQAERYQRGELTNGLATPVTRSGYADDHPVPPRTPGQFRKLDAVAVLAARLLPAPHRNRRRRVRPWRPRGSCAAPATASAVAPGPGLARRRRARSAVTMRWSYVQRRAWLRLT